MKMMHSNIKSESNIMDSMFHYVKKHQQNASIGTSGAESPSI